jgi:hypothetical protein
MNSKFCPDCKNIKNILDFNKSRNKTGHYTYCKMCARRRSKEYRIKNLDLLKEKSKYRYWNGGKEKSLAANRLYHLKNKEKRNRVSREISERDKEKIKIRRLQNKERNNKINRDYARIRCQNDPLFKFKKNIRRSTSEAFSKGKKNKKSLEILGCSLEHAFLYIESLFKPGMNWSNYGSEWHIDHIIPLASAKTIEETEKLCFYTNLQPLWARENILKSNKMDWKPNTTIYSDQT